MAEAAVERKDPIYLLTIGYVLALFIIAVMSLCIHIAIGEMVKEQNNAAVIVSARQGKLAQEIAFYATQYAAYKDGVFQEQMKDSIDLMRASHRSLLQGDPSLRVPVGLSAELDRVYHHLPYNLDQKIVQFLDRADMLLALDKADLDPNHENFRYIVEAARGPLANALDAATLVYEAESEARVSRLQSMQKMALFVIFATLIAEAMLIFRPLVRRVHNYAERLKRMAHTDVLTGVDNGRAFMHKSIKELKRTRRHGKPLSVAILDIDHFKQVNDRYGHPAGDEVLKAFAQFVLRSMRIEDEFARIGGEEFAVLLPHTNLAGAKLVADRIRSIIEISPVRFDGDRELFVTCSIGVAEVDPAAIDFEQAMEAADKALYKAKQQGRNRVVCSETYASEANVVPIGSGRGRPSP